jgi:hypothetical protein
MTLVTVHNAMEIGPYSHSELYRRLSAGRLRAVKRGRTTLIEVESIHEDQASLMPATFRPTSTNIKSSDLKGQQI